MTFDEAFKILINHEGGYVNHPHDPGGETKFGISKRSYPMENIRDLTLDRARAIYLRDYWQKAGCDYVPPKARFSLFDTAVNSGVKQATLFLQRAVGAQDDGIIGPKTLMMLEATPPAVFIARFNGHRLQFLSTLSTWPSFGRGWANRVAKNLMEA